MTSKEHSKHAKLTRRSIQKYGVLDIAIYGTSCDRITSMSSELAVLLHDKINLAYLDASHKEEERPSFTVSTIDGKSSSQQIFQNSKNEIQQKLNYRQMDLVLLNGNHFPADNQIVIIDEIKKESIKRKLDQLTNIKAIVVESSEEEIYEFLKKQLSPKAKLFYKSNLNSLADYLMELHNENIPKLKGLVLAGGKSLRMGFDKTEIKYFNKEHKFHLADLMKEHCEEVFISVSSEHEGMPNSYKYIIDSFLGLGPKGAILSAMKEDPNAAWLVLASDLPLVDQDAIKYLIDHRNPKSIATSYVKDEDSFPEPLFTIWEPKAYSVLLDFLSLGYSCPRKTLINSDTHKLIIKNQDTLINANDPTQMNQAKELIGKL